MRRQKFISKCVTATAIGALCWPALSYAQTETGPSDEEPIRTVEEEVEEEDAVLDKIYVTGSLLPRDTFSSISPIEIITPDVALLEGLTTTAEMIQSSTLATGSVQKNGTFNLSTSFGGVATNTIDLRGCGQTRNLVLLNGRRLGPSGIGPQVSVPDLSVIPASIIRQTEILKDSGSTIYGSDAICGVVNILTRDTVNGFEFSTSTNRPFESGGEQFALNAAYGVEIGSNAKFTISAAYEKLTDLSRGDREYFRCRQPYVRDAETGEPITIENRSILAPESKEFCQTRSFGTIVDSATGTTFYPSPDGVTRPSQQGLEIPGFRTRWDGTPPAVTLPPGISLPPGDGAVSIGGGGGDAFRRDENGNLYTEELFHSPIFDSEDYRPASERISIFANSEIELGAGLTFHGDLLFTRLETELDRWGTTSPIIGSATNAANNSSEFAYLIDPTYSNSLGRVARPTIPRLFKIENSTDYVFAATSLSGGFGDIVPQWGWQLNGTYSRSDADSSSTTSLTRARSSLFNDGRDFTGDGVPDMVDLPALDYFDLDLLLGKRTKDFQEALDVWVTSNTVYEQSALTAIATGPVFQLPAGTIQTAIGMEVREQSVEDTPSALERAGETGGDGLITKGSTSVVEAFAEMEVPILKNQRFAEDVALNVSLRAFDYEYGGAGSVYKVGLNWQITPTFRARGNIGTSFRAPNIFEVFENPSTTTLPLFSQDPCQFWAAKDDPNTRANCEADGIPPNFFGGGFQDEYDAVFTPGDLDPEKSKAFTAGIVFTPTWLDLKIAIDYFDIEVNDQIARLSTMTILDGCYNADVFPNDFCGFFERNSASDPDPFLINRINLETYNLDTQIQRGADLEVDYSHELDIGTVQFSGTISWFFERYVDPFGEGFVTGRRDFNNNGVIGAPSVTGNARLAFQRGDWLYNWITRFVGHQDSNRRYNADYNEPVDYRGQSAIYKVYTEAQFEHTVSARWQGDTIAITGGIRNVFDEAPPKVSSIVGGVGNVPGVSNYDVLGRTAFVSVSKRF